MAGRFEVSTPEREALRDITAQVSSLLQQLGARDGVLHLWSLHTTCALTVNEGADPDVAHDLVQALKRIAPRARDYRHVEGNSDAHVKTSLFGPGLTLLVEGGRPVLGTWQRVFLAEFDGPRPRTVAGVFVPAPD